MLLLSSRKYYVYLNKETEHQIALTVPHRTGSTYVIDAVGLRKRSSGCLSASRALK